jgi:hypothetical protein
MLNRRFVGVMFDQSRFKDIPDVVHEVDAVHDILRLALGRQTKFRYHGFGQ